MTVPYFCLMGGLLIVVYVIRVDRVRSVIRIRSWGSLDERVPAYRRRFIFGLKNVKQPVGVADTAHLALMVTEVSAYLKSGMPTDRAWRSVWERLYSQPRNGCEKNGDQWVGIDRSGVPQFVKCLADLGNPSSGSRLERWKKIWQTPGLAVPFMGQRGSDLSRAANMLVIACRLSTELGTPLAEMLHVVAESIDESESVSNARRIARSGPISSACILCALPVLGIVLGELLGAGPIKQFLDGRIGSICAVLGFSFLFVGLTVIRRMLARTRGEDEALDPAYVCDLMQAGIVSGAALPSTLAAIGRSGKIPECERIGQELTMGASWEEAWDPHPQSLSLLADVLEATWKDGTSPLTMLERAAVQMRRRRVAHARTQAEKLAIRLVIPLGLFLLPAFIFLGIVPLIIHLGSAGFGSMH